MLVRKAKTEDLNSILEFQLAMASETEGIDLERSTVEKGVAAVLKDSTKGNYYVAEKNKKVIGSLLTTFEWSDWRNGTVLWIQSVYVIPEMRKEGVFGALYSYVKELVISKPDVMGIRLYVDKRNTKAQRVYEAVGMTGEHYSTFEWMKKF